MAKTLKINIQRFAFAQGGADGAGAAGVGGGSYEDTLNFLNSTQEKYDAIVDELKNCWNNIDTWSTTYASGLTFKSTMKKTGENIENIFPEGGCGLNKYLQELTDHVRDAYNYLDQVNNEGAMQISFSFMPQNPVFPENVPETRDYMGNSQFTGFTLEANTTEIYNYIDKLQAIVANIFSEFGGINTGLVSKEDFNSQFEANAQRNGQTLDEEIADIKKVTDEYATQQGNQAAQGLTNAGSKL